MPKAQLLTLLTIAFVLGCFGPESQHTEQGSINAQLRRLLDVAPFEHPIWTTPTKLYGYRNGIVEVVIDSSTLDYRSHAEFTFSHDVWTLSYDYSARQILMIYVEDYQEANAFKAARVSLVNGQVVIEKDLVDASAEPWGVQAP